MSLLVKLIPSRIRNETWVSSFSYRPCNYELCVKQSLNMEMAIVMARAAGMDWIIHLDTDEVLHPAGATEYLLRQLIADVADDMDMVVFPNYESAIELDDIKDPFTEVSMFKENYDHVMKETYFELYREATRGNPNYFLAYGNGKAAARVQIHLRPNGAHRWHNYMKNTKRASSACLLVVATNRGITRIWETNYATPHGNPINLLDRLLIISTQPYIKEEMELILNIHCFLYRCTQCGYVLACYFLQSIECVQIKILCSWFQMILKILCAVLALVLETFGFYNEERVQIRCWGDFTKFAF